ncbi:phosphatidylinositol mannoside acyltransferase [Actinoplanes sp. KI2]|uniref:phosphatidylinositol mannoside acyltransferase n=1 Tax=Actinoplanes sp. KI2 TaxID=2983315 RepID=UPI0021D590D4|nr:phosphatidylinositol mannoside acyltransferase [Actinoplanes sp. KI2]MCU7728839.1 phosphatidylinositol mannoside acyltransferase [Actinoplanes sp. KI2]
MGPYRLGWAAVARLPVWPARALFFLVAEVVRRQRGAGVRQLHANLAQVTGAPPDSAEVRRLARLGVHSYLRYWRELFQLSRVRPPVIFERLDRLPVSGRGAILALPHSGNWDLAGAALAELGHPITTVGQRLRPEALYQRFVAARAAVGIEVLPVDEPRRTVPALGRRLAEGGVVCLLADRDVTGAGLPVRLLGRATTMPAGPARLALSTGAALIPVSLWYSGRDLRVHLHEEIAAPPAAGRRAQATAMTQALADVFTDAIRRHPQDWHVLQPVWPPAVLHPGGDQPEHGERAGERRQPEHPVPDP